MPLLQEIRAGNNGGFPQPPAGEPHRVVRCSHPVCGTETRVRLPQALPERAIHRVVCDRCHVPFPAAASLAGLIGTVPDYPPSAAELAPSPAASPTPAAGAQPARPFGFSTAAATAPAPAPAGPARRGPLAGARMRLPSLPSSLSLPSSRLWQWASIPLALVAVIAGLTLIQGDTGNPSPAAIEASNAGSTGEAAGQAKFISQPGFSLALPDGWSKAEAPEGAVFAAQSDDGLADATLWIEEDDKLTFEEFEQRSLAQLSEVGSNPRVIDRVEGPTIESTIVQLQAETGGADGSAPYRVTLRAAGPYRLYFATAIQPGAPAQLRGDTELMHGSLRPEVELAGVETGSEVSP
jgi:hypothetical protein